MQVTMRKNIPLVNTDLTKEVPSIPLLSMGHLVPVNTTAVAVSIAVPAARVKKEGPLLAPRTNTAVAQVQAVSIRKVAAVQVVSIGMAIPLAQAIPNLIVPLLRISIKKDLRMAAQVLAPARTKTGTGMETSTSPAVVLAQETNTNQAVAQAQETSTSQAAALVTSTSPAAALVTSTNRAVAHQVISTSPVAAQVININPAVAHQVTNTSPAVLGTKRNQAVVQVKSIVLLASIKNHLNRSTERSKRKIRKIEKSMLSQWKLK